MICLNRSCCPYSFSNSQRHTCYVYLHNSTVQIYCHGYDWPCSVVFHVNMCQHVHSKECHHNYCTYFYLTFEDQPIIQRGDHIWGSSIFLSMIPDFFSIASWMGIAKIWLSAETIFRGRYSYSTFKYVLKLEKFKKNILKN